MIPHERRMNPYIQRMAEDMQVRNFSSSTIDSYTWHVDKFCQYFGKPADQLGPEEIRTFQLYLVNEKKASWSSFNQAVCGLRFLYEVTLGRPWTVQHIPYGKRPKKLPMVLSDQEAAKLIECVENPKHRAVLLTCYAVGLRLSEATHLKIADIDGQRQQIRIIEGKGRKDRIVPASPRLLEELREYWKLHKPSNYLFPGKTQDVPLSSATIQKACKMAAAFAGITKVISPHVLRHSFATGMLEAGVDVLTISKLLGHSSFVTTMVYLHVRRQHFDRSPSPLDWLPTRQCPQWAERREPTQPMDGQLLPTATPLEQPQQPPHRPTTASTPKSTDATTVRSVQMLSVVKSTDEPTAAKGARQPSPRPPQAGSPVQSTPASTSPAQDSNQKPTRPARSPRPARPRRPRRP